jgi:hypothetical protein
VLFQLQVHIFYLDGYLLRCQRSERGIGYCLAISASSSIAGWVIWQKYGAVWAVIIAASQVVSAIRHLLPSRTRSELLQQVLPDLSSLFVEAERDFYDVIHGELTDRDIHERAVEIQGKKMAIANRLNKTALHESRSLLGAAETRASQYFHTMYGSEE